PRDGFAIQLGPEDPPPGAPEERTLVETDLTMPGSIAGPGQVGPDPLFPPPYEVKWGDYLEPGFHTGPYHFRVHCGIEWLGEFNGLGWRTGDPMPDRWREMTTRGETIEVTLLLHAAPTRNWKPLLVESRSPTTPPATRSRAATRDPGAPTRDPSC